MSIPRSTRHRSGQTNNLFVLSETGQFQSSVDLVTNVTREPTGAAYDPTGNRLFISDDDSKGIFIVSASDPGGPPLGFIDVSAISSDTEDPLYDPTTGHLMFLEGGRQERPDGLRVHDRGCDRQLVQIAGGLW